MIQALHHIGIAVPDLEAAVPLYRDTLGLAFQGIQEVPTEGVRVAVFLAGSTRIELLEPTREDSAVARFLARRGPGVHHLAFKTDSAEEALAGLRRAGLPVLDEAPRPGAHGTRVGFVHPKGLLGVLAEVVEDPA